MTTDQLRQDADRREALARGSPRWRCPVSDHDARCDALARRIAELNPDWPQPGMAAWLDAQAATEGE